jgi:DNA-binding MarR family transcriptional regulator
LNDDVLKLENQLCFPLYAAAKKVVGAYKPYLEEIGLTYTQYITMMVLWESKSMLMRELGECLYLDSGTLTPLLKRLESKKLIRRERGEDDGRTLIVTVTEEGEALKEKAMRIPMQMAQCMPMEREDTAKLYDLLYKILR